MNENENSDRIDHNENESDRRYEAWKKWATIAAYTIVVSGATAAVTLLRTHKTAVTENAIAHVSGYMAGLRDGYENGLLDAYLNMW